MPNVYQPVAFNFIDLEEKATTYLDKVKADAVNIATEARNEVARLRETALAEIERTRSEAQRETAEIRRRLDALHEKLRNEEATFLKQKERHDADILKHKQVVRETEESARKKGYDDGHQLGYDEGRKKGYTDGELQANIDYAEKVRREAEIQLAAKLETLYPALQNMVGQLESARQSFLLLWEQSAIHVAKSIAEQAIGRQLPEMIDVPLRLLRESLELGAGSASVKVRLNPVDYESLRPQVDGLIDEMTVAARMEVVPDHRVMPGGCLLETSLGVIDNQIDSRLERIEQELCQVGN